MSNWNKFVELSARERWHFVRATVWLAAIGIALKIVPFRTCQAALAWLTPDARPSTNLSDIRLARNVAGLVRAAGRHGPTGFTCLRESLVLWYLLRRNQIRSQLRIGVRKDGQRFEAHAWVELDGRVLNDTSDVHLRFAAFERSLGDA